MEEEKITNILELVAFIKNSFQTAQEHVDEKFEKTASKQDLLDLSVKLLPREEFIQFKQETNKNFEELKVSVNNLTNSEDGLVKKESTASQEETMTTAKLKRHENWLLLIAGKLGIKLES